MIDSMTNRLDEFGTEMQDGRLTEPSDGKIYKLWEAILASKKLGRLLTVVEFREGDRTVGWNLCVR